MWGLKERFDDGFGVCLLMKVLCEVEIVLRLVFIIRNCLGVRWWRKGLLRFYYFLILGIY